jgi:hypothetical protein
MLHNFAQLPTWCSPVRPHLQDVGERPSGLVSDVDKLTEVEAVGPLCKAHSDVSFPSLIFDSDDKISRRIKDSLYRWPGRVVRCLRECYR